MADDDDFDDSFWHTGPRGAVLRRQHHGTIVIFEHGFAIHDGVNLLEKTYKTAGASAAGPQGKDNIDIYFETDDLQAAYSAVTESGADVIHPIETQQWGQRVFRFHDPDGHIIEIGDPM